jgi:tetratricopeptide (TPR) repeat protein
MYERAIDITRRAYGEDHVLVGRQLALLANLERRRGRTDESIRLYREAEALLSARLGAVAPEVSSLRVTMGQTYAAGGRPEAALPIYRQARGELEASVEPHDPAVATVLILEGEALLALRRPRDALEPLEKLNRFPTGGVPPRDLGVFRFALARALWESRADRARARALAAEARDYLAAAGASWKSDLAEIEAWIAER